MIALAGAILGGGAFRLRGWSGFARLTGRGATTARLMWAIVMGAFAVAVGAAWPVASAVAVGLFLGSTLPWWQSITLGRDSRDGPAAWQYLRHAARGVLWTAPAAAMAAGAAILVGMPWHPWAWLALAGLACVPAYDAGWRLRPVSATEIGEVLFGAVIGAAVGIAA